MSKDKCKYFTIKSRLYPSPAQKDLFTHTFSCARKIYNLILEDAIASYKTNGIFELHTPAYYKTTHPYLKDVDSLALANAYIHLQAAFKARFDKSRKKQNGFPKFKSAKHSRKSYCTNNQIHGDNQTIRFDEFSTRLRLPKAGFVKIRLHRNIPVGATLKSVTVSQDPDSKYYAAILFQVEDAEVSYTPCLDNAIGLDYASDGLYVDSNGTRADFPKYYRQSQMRLGLLQRRLSRKRSAKHGEVPSANYEKHRKKVASFQKHVTNQRKDAHHKLSKYLADTYDIVCVESLNMKALANKSFGNGRATLDNGYGQFIDFLSYKLRDRGKRLIRVDKYYPSSQLCSSCGTKHNHMKDLTIRTLECSSCGASIDRDYNAALNILAEGRRLYMETR